MLALVEKGMVREEAYKLVQQAAMRSWKEKRAFRDIIDATGELSSRLDKKELDSIFDIDRHFKYVDDIFGRVFGDAQ
jgi:adenylosuccinate lyase